MKRAHLLLSSLFAASLAFLPSSAGAQGTVTFGGGAKADTKAPTPPASPPPAAASGAAASPSADEALAASVAEAVERDAEAEWAERERKLDEGATLTGGVGLVHTQHAQGGAPGQFRAGFTTEFFDAAFLCSNQYPCLRSDGRRFVRDDASHIGGRLTLSAQLAKWLEAYLATSAYANSNSTNRPALLQVLGDSVMGAKVHGALGRVFHLGGAFELLLVNGTGGVGLDGGGTSAKIRGLATVDLRGAKKPVPVRFSLNTTYVVDNSGQVIADTERTRGAPITRVERFGLNINRVDHFDIHLGAELFAAKQKVRPFIEYNIAIPINRQDYRCRQNNPSQDGCLAIDAVAPSSFTLGGRFFPWKSGFHGLLALDIGTSGVSSFIEEMAPRAPWMLYLGAGWSFDTVDRPPVVEEVVVDRSVPRARGRKIRGFVHEEGKPEGIADAIIHWDNRPGQTALATDEAGRFVTHELEEGPYNFSVRAEGYRLGQCATSVVRAMRPGDPMTGPYAAPAPGGAPAPGSSPASPGETMAGPQRRAVDVSADVELDCPLVALPRKGAMTGHVRDAESQAAVANATVRVLDAQKNEVTATTDASGAYRFDTVAPGEAQITVTADGYLALTMKSEVKPRIDNVVELPLTVRPKNANVTVGKNEITIKQQVQFGVDSAVILPESTALLTEIADVLIKNARIRRIEVQGHTDNTGTPDHNLRLSEERASAVVTWLTSHGVEQDRLTSKGFGQTKPLVPNVTAGNRAKNRRVQFIIVDQDPEAPKGKKP